MDGLKAVIGEYGKVILLALIFCSTALFLFSKGENGFLGMLGSAAPIESVGHNDAFEIAGAIAARAVPELSVRVRKLKKGKEYNLLDGAAFEVRAENEEGEKVDVDVIKVVNPRGEDITEAIVPQHFIPVYSGAYSITYQAVEVYLGSKKVREREYCFVAD